VTEPALTAICACLPQSLPTATAVFNGLAGKISIRPAGNLRRIEANRLLCIAPEIHDRDAASGRLFGGTKLPRQSIGARDQHGSVNVRNSDVLT